MSDLQHAQFSALLNPAAEDNPLEPYTLPLPASMERHAPGEYQPTLPGMERMLKGETTHTSVLFNHKNAVDNEDNDVVGSKWHLARHPVAQKQHYVAQVPRSNLEPTQDWVDDNHLYEAPNTKTLARSGPLPRVEKIGSRRVVMDGHHRMARQVLSGNENVDVLEWEHRG